MRLHRCVSSSVKTAEGSRDGTCLMWLSSNGVASLTVESLWRWLPVLLKTNFNALVYACVTVKFDLGYVLPLGHSVQRSMQKLTSNFPSAFLVVPYAE